MQTEQTTRYNLTPKKIERISLWIARGTLVLWLGLVLAHFVFSR